MGLIDDLLDDEESTILEFKRDQYCFSGAIEIEKDELLKDILALANASKRTDAYILIGVKGSPRERKTISEATEHFDYATLQQFVNGKTNRPIPEHAHE